MQPSCLHLEPDGSQSLLQHVVALSLLGAMALMTAACERGLVVPTESANAFSHLVAGRALLPADQTEGTGYGLYSYLVFEAPPTSENRAKYIVALEACLGEVPDLERLEKKYPKARLNAMFIPVRESLRSQAVGPPGQSNRERVRSQAQRILEGYDYSRASTILARLRKGVRTRKKEDISMQGGPYLVSSLRPASADEAPTPTLFQDLSATKLISSEDQWTGAVFKWVLDFVGRVSIPQPGLWNRASLEGLRNELLNSQRTAFFHAHVPSEKLPDLEPYIAIVFPLEDERTNQTFDVPEPRFQRKDTDRWIWLVRQR